MTNGNEVPRDVSDVLAQAAQELGDPGRLTVSELRGVQSLNNSLWTIRGPSPPGKWVLRIANPAGASHLGIRRPDECAAASSAATAGIGPSVTYYDQQSGHMITPWIESRPDWHPAEFRDPARMRQLVTMLHRLHSIRVTQRDTATIFRRIDYLLNEAETLGAYLPNDLNTQRSRLHDIEENHTVENPTLNHNDLWANNLLDDGHRLWLIDWEFAGAGDGLYDLATISMAGGYDSSTDRRMLAEYGKGTVEQLDEMKWVVRLFEGAWSSVMDRLVRGTNRPFNYGAHARRMFDELRSAR